MAAKPGYLQLLRENRGFRLLWGGTVVSFLGDWLTTVAVLTMVGELSDSALVIAGVLIAKTLPIFLISPVAGPLADQHDRKTLMIATDVIRAVLVLAMIACWWARSVELLLVVLTARTLVGGVFIPARTAAIPDLAADEELPAAVALMGGTWSVMLAIGAALGGVLTAWVGITGALLIDAATFMGSAALLWGLPALPPHDHETVGRATFVDGLRHLRGRIYLPVLLLLKSANALSGGVLVLLPLFAGGIFADAQGPLFLGLLYAARGVGALGGTMGVRLVLGDALRTLQWSIVLGFGILGTMYVLMSQAPSFPGVAVCLGFSAVGTGMVWTFSDTLGQMATTREVRGRLFAMEFGLTMLASSAASLATGALVDAGVDPRTVLAGLGVGSLLPAVVWAGVLVLGRDVQRTTTA
ncbi:MAG: MFS transporter [Alphaproteobacteria bacterium]|nr:MFS transporter [Alphaproteobacteria bacterium]